VAARLGLRFAALGYLAALLAFPVGLVFWRTFEDGLGPVWNAATNPEALHALWLTVLIALIAVPANTIFGVICALVIVRGGRFHGKTLLNALVDLPFALSPVVIGLALYLVYARTGWFGGWLVDHGINVIFALPGMILATIFVSLPFVVRETVPVLREIGTEHDGACDRGVRSRLDRVRQHRRPHGNPDPARAAALPGLRSHGCVHCVGRAGVARSDYAPVHDSASEGDSRWR
jgi:sulfate/thiosulfate transport system permease protein